MTAVLTRRRNISVFSRPCRELSECQWCHLDFSQDWSISVTKNRQKITNNWV